MNCYIRRYNIGTKIEKVMLVIRYRCVLSADTLTCQAIVGSNPAWFVFARLTDRLVSVMRSDH